MIKIKPVGNRLIAKPINEDVAKTDSGLYAVDSKLAKAVIVEISEQDDGAYKEGDFILYNSESGIGQLYGEPLSPHIWLKTGTNSDDIWGIVNE